MRAAAVADVRCSESFSTRLHEMRKRIGSCSRTLGRAHPASKDSGWTFAVSSTRASIPDAFQ